LIPRLLRLTIMLKWIIPLNREINGTVTISPPLTCKFICLINAKFLFVRKHDSFSHLWVSKLTTQALLLIHCIWLLRNVIYAIIEILNKSIKLKGYFKLPLPVTDSLTLTWESFPWELLLQIPFNIMLCSLKIFIFLDKMLGLIYWFNNNKINKTKDNIYTDATQ
jgi:hypothetical protein